MTRWTGHCTGCASDDAAVESRCGHAARVLCDRCAAKPHRPPSAERVGAMVQTSAGVAKPAIAGVIGPARYAGRRVDVAELLAEPDVPIPWRCDRLIADGFLTTLAGQRSTREGCSSCITAGSGPLDPRLERHPRQTDALFTLARETGDPEQRTRRQLKTAKCRIDEEPEPRWLAIEADRSRGLVFVIEAEPYEGDGGPSSARHTA